MKTLHGISALVLALMAPASAAARVTFKITEQGAGFHDQTAAVPVGGNAGTTLGEQRHLALAHAFELWAGYLDSAVPIDVDVEFDDLGCGSDGVVLGQAGAVSYEAEVDAPRADPLLLYPSALANSLTGQDLDPSRPDIKMSLNTAPDDTCRSRTRGFYYGFDGRAGDANDFVEIVLHELAHGLGFSSTVDLATGALAADHIDAFSAQLLDADTNQRWSQLTAARRSQSASSARRLAWAGPEAKRVAAKELTFAQPRLKFTPAVPQFSGLISDTNIGMPASSTGLMGPVVLGQNCGVARPAGMSEAWVAMFTGCDPVVAARAAHEAGAAAALLMRDSAYELPPMPLETDFSDPLGLPLLMLSTSDARNIQLSMSAGAVSALISSDSQQRLGADAAGHPLMFASSPVSRGSSVSHVDPSLRPNQLMEPFATPEPQHNLALTRAFLQDIGWLSGCGDGQLDPTEECDQGADNDNNKPGGCRSDCRKAHCGDGVKDEGEACDDGHGNDNRRPNACRTDCKPSHCGDGVTDDKEQCDDGAHNDDRMRGACRTSCRFAYCGDGIIDALEQCDDGLRNDSRRADRCRMDCRAPRCGDSVVDRGEECDEGVMNGEGRAHACRSDCSSSTCRDGIVDGGEACDGGADCTSGCQADQPEPPVQSHGIQDSSAPEAVEAGMPYAREPEEPRALSQGRGCSCRTFETSERRSRASSMLCALILVVWRLRRSRSRRPC